MPVTNGQKIAAAAINSSAYLSERIPTSMLDNINDFGSMMLNDRMLMNEFINAIQQKFILTKFQNGRLSNPLAKFKKGDLSNRVGFKIEEILITPAKAIQYLVDYDQDNHPYKMYRPNVEVGYYYTNNERYYPMTFHQLELKEAFTSWDNLETFVSKQLQSLYDGDEVDEYILMRSLFKEHYDKGGYLIVKVGDISTEEGQKRLLKEMRYYANIFQIPTNDLNPLGVERQVDVSNIDLFMDARADAELSVDILSYMFKDNYAKASANKMLVDGLGTDDMVAMITERDFFQVYDTYFGTASNNGNPVNLTTNEYLHHHQILATSKFVNAVIFVTDTDKKINSLTVSPHYYVKPKGSTFTGVGSLRLVKGLTQTEIDAIEFGVITQVTNNTDANTKITITKQPTKDDLTFEYSITVGANETGNNDIEFIVAQPDGDTEVVADKIIVQLPQFRNLR